MDGSVDDSGVSPRKLPGLPSARLEPRQQRAAADAGKSRLGGKSKQLTKSKFLAELKKSTAGEREGVVAGGGAAGEKKESASGGGWDVLSDGYLMGRNKLKDWDKGTKEAETEVEYEDEDLE